jgi:hypothetical protein
LLQKDTDLPQEGEEDYVVRLELIADAVQVWGNEQVTLWKELFTSLSEAPDGDKTIVAGKQDYDVPSDFVFPVGFVRIGSRHYKNIPLTDIQTMNNPGNENCWFIGNKNTGYRLHINDTFGSMDEGADIEYEYYKEPTIPSKGTDIFEMNDPGFAVYWVIAELIADEDPGLASKYSQIAENKMNAMKIRNEMTPWHQGSGIDTGIGLGI